MLDALESLGPQREAVVLIGAQAIYQHTGELNLPLAEMTKDADLAIDPSQLDDTPLLEQAMKSAGFMRLDSSAPGTWVSVSGVPVDFLVPELLAGAGRRSARIPPHSKDAARQTRGIEACLVDNEVMIFHSFDPMDEREFEVKVAGPAALLVAKTHKIADRAGSPHRLDDKDAHDCYRILQAIETEILAQSILKLTENELSRTVTLESIEHLKTHFSQSTNSLACQKAGRAEEGVGDPKQVALTTMLLSLDLVNALTLEVKS